jgi:chorismate mutase/prephenate dehydrogenase
VTRDEIPSTPEEGREEERLEGLRQEILEVDQALVELVGRRRALVLEIGALKEELGMLVLDPAREAAVVRRAVALARERGVDEELLRDVIWRIIASAREEQERAGS